MIDEPPKPEEQPLPEGDKPAPKKLGAGSSSSTSSCPAGLDAIYCCEGLGCLCDSFECCSAVAGCFSVVLIVLFATGAAFAYHWIASP